MVSGVAAAAAGLAAAAAAFLLVGGLPGTLYAAGIALASLFGAGALSGHRPHRVPAPDGESRAPRWRRKASIIEELELELATTGAELAEHRWALASLGAQLARETETARATQEKLEARVGELEGERDRLCVLLAEERERFERTITQLDGGIDRHGSELDELERELEALIGR
jgi:chromosome segregation ATPase